MRPVKTTDFFTPVGSARSPETLRECLRPALCQHMTWPSWAVLWLWVALLGGLLTAMPRSAQAASIQQITLDRTEEGLFLSSAIDLEVGPAVEDALLRSVPVYFVVQADVLRERWYWSDKRVASASRTYRLAYQPLTRRWRLSVSTGSGPGGGLQYALHQNHASLSQAMAVISRLSSWPVAEASRLEAGGSYRVEFRFKLDMALLPRPFQLDMNAQSDWHLDLAQSLEVPPLVVKPADKDTEAAVPPSSAPTPVPVPTTSWWPAVPLLALSAKAP